MITDRELQYAGKWLRLLFVTMIISFTAGCVILTCSGISIGFLYGQNQVFKSREFTNKVVLEVSDSLQNHIANIERNGCFSRRKNNDKQDQTD